MAKPESAEAKKIMKEMQKILKDYRFLESHIPMPCSGLENCHYWILRNMYQLLVADD